MRALSLSPTATMARVGNTQLHTAAATEYDEYMLSKKCVYVCVCVCMCENGANQRDRWRRQQRRGRRGRRRRRRNVMRCKSPKARQAIVNTQFGSWRRHRHPPAHITTPRPDRRVANHRSKPHIGCRKDHQWSASHSSGQCHLPVRSLCVSRLFRLFHYQGCSQAAAVTPPHSAILHRTRHKMPRMRASIGNCSAGAYSQTSTCTYTGVRPNKFLNLMLASGCLIRFDSS